MNYRKVNATLIMLLAAFSLSNSSGQSPTSTSSQADHEPRFTVEQIKKIDEFNQLLQNPDGVRCNSRDIPIPFKTRRKFLPESLIPDVTIHHGLIRLEMGQQGLGGAYVGINESPIEIDGDVILRELIHGRSQDYPIPETSLINPETGMLFRATITLSHTGLQIVSSYIGKIENVLDSIDDVIVKLTVGDVDLDAINKHAELSFSMKGILYGKMIGKTLFAEEDGEIREEPIFAFQQNRAIRIEEESDTNLLKGYRRFNIKEV